MFNYGIKHIDLIHNPSKMLALPDSQRQNVLKAMANLSKYLGIYEQYKRQLKGYGIKWNNQDIAFNAFLAIFSKKHDTLPEYIKEITPLLYDNEKLFLRFLAITGLRKQEAITSFNMIIQLFREGRLTDYYNEDLSVLEHFKYGKLFLRNTKNAYISFVSKAMIEDITNSKKVSYNAIHCRLLRRKIKLRLKELRSYNNSYLRKHGILSELVDVLAGRIPKSVFCRHYLGENMRNFSNQVLSISEDLEKSIFSAPKAEMLKI